MKVLKEITDMRKCMWDMELNEKGWGEGSTVGNCRGEKAERYISRY